METQDFRTILWYLFKLIVTGSGLLISILIFPKIDGVKQAPGGSRRAPGKHLRGATRKRDQDSNSQGKMSFSSDFPGKLKGKLGTLKGKSTGPQAETSWNIRPREAPVGH